MAFLDFLDSGFFKNPNTWLGALAGVGSAAGLYDVFSNRGAQNRYERDMQRQQQEYLARESDWRNRVQGAINAPLNLATAVPENVIRQLSRNAAGDVSLQGLQPGGAYYAGIGERVLPTVYQSALTQREQDINALLGTRPQQLGSYRPGPSPTGFAGVVDPMAKYLQYIMQERSTRQARESQEARTREWMEYLKRQFPGVPQTAPQAPQPGQMQLPEAATPPFVSGGYAPPGYFENPYGSEGY